MRGKVLMTIPRTVRKGNGSLTIALPRAIHDLLELKSHEEVNVVVYSTGRVGLEKGNK